MKSKWSNKDASRFSEQYGKLWGEDLALRVYSSRLIGVEKELVLHGGGNTSVKGTFTNILGKRIPAVYVKASGHNLATIEPAGLPGLDLEILKRLRELSELSDDVMVNELRTNLFDARAATPSIETLLHAFIPAKYVDHTHADVIIALTNQPDGQNKVRDAFGDDVVVLDYVKPGFLLAKASAEAFESSPASKGIVLKKHGLLTWGGDAKESYERTVDLVTKAEEYLAKKGTTIIKTKNVPSRKAAEERYLKIAPVLRGSLAIQTQNADRPYKRFILRSLINEEMLSLLNSEKGKEILLTPAITADHLIRTKALPMWLSDLSYDDNNQLRKQIQTAVSEYAKQYDSYFERHSARKSPGLARFDSMPRIILIPGVGAVCAGRDVVETGIVRDITTQTLAVKAKIAAMGTYEGLGEDHIFDMEYFSLQHAKLDREEERPLLRSVALVTGAAGAIGAGICQELLQEGCHVAVTDLPGDRLNSLVDDFKDIHGDRAIPIPLDVTDPDSVTQAFDSVIREWGGVDLVVANAGAAFVAALSDMDPDAFRTLEQVNIEGTLNILAEAGRRFEIQNTGGDIVLISTKNVMAPGAKFGAYSATKAAAHQLARIASLELAGIDVRVNMVSPDAVFSHGQRKSGLWAEVGPERMRARGLDEKGLQEYYRNRNLLKAKVTASHVAKAVLFFATRQTPTTGATLPVDGGLPDATPR